MTPRLRTRHLSIWLGFALVLPLLAAFVVFGLPEPNLQLSDLASRSLVDLPYTLKEAEGADLHIRFKGNTPDQAQQLEIEILQPLAQPTAWVYVSAKPELDQTKDHLLGYIGSQGTYQFPIDSLAQQWKPIYVTVFDGIHHRITHQLTL